jgi:hypothetical protein
MLKKKRTSWALKMKAIEGTTGDSTVFSNNLTRQSSSQVSGKVKIFLVKRTKDIYISRMHVLVVDVECISVFMDAAILLGTWLGDTTTLGP